MPFTPDPVTKSSFTPDDSPQEPSLMDKLKSMGGDVAGIMNAYHGALIKGATLGQVDPNKLQDKVYGGSPFQDNAREHNVADMVGQMHGGLAPAQAAGALANAAAGAMGVAQGGGVLGTLARSGLNAGAGAGMSAIAGGDPKVGAIMGGGGTLLAEGASAFKRPAASFAGIQNEGQQDAYFKDPARVQEMAKEFSTGTEAPRTQDEAVNAINTSSKNIQGKLDSSLESLKGVLGGKQLPVNLNEYAPLANHESVPEDMRNEVGQVLSKYKNQYGQLPTQPAPIDGNDANLLKRAAQKAASYESGHVLDPVQKATVAEWGAKAANLRQGLEGLDDSVKGLNQSVQEGTYLKGDLKKALKRPIGYVKSADPDRVASLARMDDAGAGGLRDYGNTVGAANALAKAHSPSNIILRTIAQLKEKTALPAARFLNDAGQTASTSANSLAALLANLQSDSQKK